MLMNAMSAVHVRMEAHVSTTQDHIHAVVFQDLLETTVKMVKYL